MSDQKTRTLENTREATESSHARENLRTFVNEELDRYSKKIIPLLTIRHDLFDVNQTEYDPGLPIVEQLYDHPSNNIDFMHHDLGLRRGNVLNYHETTEHYDRGHSAEFAERDRRYRQAILETAQDLGFISPEPSVATNPLDRSLGILDSTFEKVSEPVAAIVINGAAGMANIKRMRDAIRNIESGAINTNRIILSGGTRPVGDAEKGRVKPPYRAGDTEFELTRNAAEDLLGISFGDTFDTFSVEYGDGLVARHQSTTAAIGDRVVTIDVVEAPFDNTRTLDDGSPAKRINTEEAFLAVNPIIESIPGAIVMESHDTWAPWQNLIAHKIYSLTQGRNVYPAAPFNEERVYTIEDNGSEVTEITAPQDVVDEIIKTYKQLVQMSTELQAD